MSPNRYLRRVLAGFLLLAGFVFTSLPVRAQPARHPLAEIQKVALLGESALSWVRNAFASLWRPELAKEGPSIDPNGKPQQQGTDEGVTIDPSGRK
jgi:hypothetical protein